MDRVNDVAQLQISNIDERRVQSCLRAVGLEVKVALRATIASPVLIIALVWRDEGKRRHLAGREVFIQTPFPLESDDVLGSRFEPVLHAAEIHKWVVLRGVELQKVARNVARNSDVGEVAVTISGVVGARRRQALLVALPRHAFVRELVRDRFTHGVPSGIDTQSTVDVDLGAGSRTLVPRDIDSGRGGVSAGAINRTDRPALGGVEVRRRRLRKQILGARTMVPTGTVLTAGA